MKPEKAKPEKEIKKVIGEKDKNLFIMCERCGRVYEDPKNVPARCDHCGYCLFCGN